MDLKNLAVFNAAGQSMQYLTARQKVLATNIANANTPGFLAQDVEKPADLEGKSPMMAMSVTNSKHFSQVGIPSKTQFKVYTPKPTSALTIDGNGVVLEDQMNEASKTSSEYSRVITLYNSYKAMLKTANTKINA